LAGCISVEYSSIRVQIVKMISRLPDGCTLTKLQLFQEVGGSCSSNVGLYSCLVSPCNSIVYSSQKILKNYVTYIELN